MSAYKFDSANLKLFEQYVAFGLTETNAAVLAFGIDRTTYFRWRQDHSPLSTNQKCNLNDSFEQGAAIRNLKLVKSVNNSIEKGDGRLALTLLQRFEPKTYGIQTKNLSLNHENLNSRSYEISDAQLKRILE